MGERPGPNPLCWHCGNWMFDRHTSRKCVSLNGVTGGIVGFVQSRSAWQFREGGERILFGLDLKPMSQHESSSLIFLKYSRLQAHIQIPKS